MTEDNTNEPTPDTNAPAPVETAAEQAQPSVAETMAAAYAAVKAKAAE